MMQMIVVAFVTLASLATFVAFVTLASRATRDASATHDAKVV